MKKDFASVSWRVEDIQDLREDWSDEMCAEFLEENEDIIQQMMIQRGWDAIEDLLPHFDPSESEEELSDK
jgi:hypothetical protein